MHVITIIVPPCPDQTVKVSLTAKGRCQDEFQEGLAQGIRGAVLAYLRKSAEKIGAQFTHNFNETHGNPDR